MVNSTTFLVTYKPTGPSGTISLSGDYADIAGNPGAKGASFTFTSTAPQMALSDPSARTIDEDQHNTGRIVAGGITITDADNRDFAGGSLRAHIDNRVSIQNVGGEVLGIRGLSDGSVFFRAVGDDIYYRQGTIVAADGTVTTSDANPGDDIKIGSIATIGGVRQDGSHGADLVINLNENATPAITQTLASNIVFAIRLQNGANTQAWQDFVRPDTSVTFTLNDGQGNASTVTKPINVVSQNDAPVAGADVNIISQSATVAATGNILANDTDADNAPGMTPQLLRVSDVASGANHASFVGTEATLQGLYGVLTISSTGAYSYALNNSNAQVAALVTGQTLTESFTYNVSDGAAQTSSTLAITINGASANVAPVAAPDRGVATSLASTVSGNLLANDTDANGQALHVTSIQVGATNVAVPASGGATLHGAFGDLTVTADGGYTYTPNTSSPVVAHLPEFRELHETFTYTISDGAGGTTSSTIDAGVANSPFRVTGTGRVDVVRTDAQGAMLEIIDTINLSSSPIHWSPDISPADGTYYLKLSSADNSATISIKGGAPVSQFVLKVVAVADLPPTTAGDNAYYIIHDTQAHIVAADTAGTPLRGLIDNNHLLAVISKDAPATQGPYPYAVYGESQLGVTLFDPQIALPTSAITINEDAVTYGRLVGFNGTGLGIADGQGNSNVVGVRIGSPYHLDLAGGSLTAHIDHPQGVAGVGGEFLFLNTGNGLFSVTSTGQIYWRSEARISGSTAGNITADLNAADDVRVGSFAFVDGHLLNGMDGRDLKIFFDGSASADVVQLLAGQIGFGIGLANHTPTPGWENFVPPAGQQQSVTFTVTDARGGTNSATRIIDLQPVNDAPVALADIITTLKTASVEGSMLANDSDPDNIVGMPHQAQTLTVSTVKGQDVSATGATSITGAYGALTISADGVYSYTPNAANAEIAALGTGQSKVDTFDYSISDGHGGTATSTLAVTINGVTPGNAAPVATADAARLTPYAPATGNVLTNDSDPEHQTLTVSGAALNQDQMTEVTPDGLLIFSEYGVLRIFGDGAYAYTPDPSAVRAHVPFFASTTETFRYQVSDGHGGSSTASLRVEVVNSPFVIKAATPGIYVISEMVGSVPRVIDTVVLTADGLSKIWIPPNSFSPGDGVHVLSVGGGAGVSTFGGETTSSVTLNILDVASLPSTPAADTVYVVHDTRAHIAAAAVAGTPFSALVSSGAVLGVQLNGSAPAVGTLETFTNMMIPVIGYDTQISLPGTTRVVNENDNNSGKLIAFKGTELAIAAGTEDASSVGPVISDSDGTYAAGSTLRVHINNAVYNSTGGDVLFLKQGSNLFRTDSEGRIYYRQDTRISGLTSDAVVTDANPNDDILFAAFTKDASGKLMNGLGGRDLVVAFNDAATIERVQLLAGHIGFGIRLNTADGAPAYTQAWEQFLPAPGTQQSVTYTITDVAGRSNSATRNINVEAVNDAPVAVADSVATLKTAAVSGFVLGNDTDADNIAGLTPSQTLSVTNVNQQPLAATGATVITGAYGALTISADGVYSYTPNAAHAEIAALGSGQSRVDTFTYSISDGHGGTATSTLAVTINGATQSEPPTPNAPPTALSDDVSGTPYGVMSGNVLLNDADPEQQTLKVSRASAHEEPTTELTMNGLSLTGTYGVLNIRPDGSYTYTPDLSVVRERAPLFSTVRDTFSYQVSDGHEGFDTALLRFDVVNSPFVLTAPQPGLYTVSDTTGGVVKPVGAFRFAEDSLSSIWIPPTDFTPGDGVHELSVSDDASFSIFGGAATSPVTLNILDIARLPQAPAANTVYIIHDTRAHVDAASVANTAFTAFAASKSILGVVLNGTAQPTGGGAETFTSWKIPVIGYDTQISLPDTAQVVNENDYNSGRLIAFKGTGLAIAEGTEVPSSVGPVITDSDDTHAAGSTLRVHINNAVFNAAGGDVLFLKQGSNLFRTDSAGNIYHRQDTTINGATSDAVVVDSNSGDDVLFASFTRDASGNLMNGMGGRDLVVAFNDQASIARVQLLAGHIGFGIRLNTTDGTPGYTQAWEQFLPAAGTQQSVTYTITDAEGRSNSATRNINVQAVNDAPVAVADSIATAKSAAVSGFVLANDSDADNIAGLAPAQTLTVVSAREATVGSAATVNGATTIAGKYGSLSISADGSYTYTPDQNNTSVAGLANAQTLLDQFVYGISDGHGGTASSTLTVTVTGPSVNPPPSTPTLTGPSSTFTLDENINNEGHRLSGVTVGGGSPANCILTATINNRAGFAGLQGEGLDLNTGSDQLTMASDGKIYVGALLIGQMRTEGGVLLDGKQGRSLSIALNGDATTEIVQLLVDHLGFAIRMSNRDQTEAWGPFATASKTVTLALSNTAGNLASTDVAFSIVSQNDAPTAHADFAAMGKGQSTVTGGVLANDDPDVLSNIGANSANLPAGLAVTSIAHGAVVGSIGSAVQGEYGSLTIAANGSYTYTLTTQHSAVQGLTSGALTDVFHYTMTDGTASSSADLKIVIDPLAAHWGSSNKITDNSSAAIETVFRNAEIDETRYVSGFDGADILGAVGLGTVNIDGGTGDDVMFALANYTTLKGGVGADKFVIGSADIHVRIEDIDIVANNDVTNFSLDVLDMTQLFGGMTQAEIESFVSTHRTQITDAATGKVATVINFDGLKGVAHTGDLTIVGLTNAQADKNMQVETTPISSVNYTLLDELRLIAANHG
jgi:VCBS repeat-containing protein